MSFYAGGVFAFMSGLLTMGYLVAGAFFLRFWTRTRDRLFAIFAAAFWLLALNQALIALSGLSREEQSWIFVLRLAAFMLIAAAIVLKNSETSARP